MKSLILALALALVVAAAATVPGVAEARRIGGGGAVGMQRSLPPRAPERCPPARPRRSRKPPLPRPPALLPRPRRAARGSARSPASPPASALPR